MRGCLGNEGECWHYILFTEIDTPIKCGVSYLPAMAQQPTADSTKNKKILTQIEQEKPNLKLMAYSRRCHL
jgi:hypothetical protein